MPHDISSPLQRLLGPLSSLSPATEEPSLRLPKDTPRDIKRRWNNRLREAKELLLEIREPGELERARKRLQDRGQRIALRSQHGEALIERRFVLRGFRDPDSDVGSSGLSSMGGGAVIGATPDGVDAGAHVLACVEHGIQRVVELDSLAERSGTQTQSYMGKGKLEGDGIEIEIFQWKPTKQEAKYQSKNRGTASPRGGLQAFDPSITSDLLRVHPNDVYRLPNGKLVVGEPAADPKDARHSRRAKHVIERWQVPLAPDQAIRPDLLLAVMKEVAGPWAEEGAPTLFHSLDGDRRAAVFAAAAMINDCFRKGRLDRNTLLNEVEVACKNVGHKRNPDLITDPADVASLLAFGDLLLEEARKLKPAASRRVEFAPMDLAEDELDEGSDVESGQEGDVDSHDDQSSGSDIASSR